MNKNRTVSIAASLFLTPLVQPLLVGSGVVLTSAVSVFLTSINVKAETADFYFKRGYKKMNDLNDNQGAIQDFNKAIEKDPTNNTIYLNRGTAKLTMKDIQGAISDFTKVIQNEPNNYMAYFGRAAAKSLEDKKSGCNDLKKSSSLGFELAKRVFTAECATSANKKTNVAKHSDCKDARDYEGCMKYQTKEDTPSNKSNQSDSDCDSSGWCVAGDGKDSLGIPKLKGWRYLDDAVNRKVLYKEYTTRKFQIGNTSATLPKMHKVMVRGKYGRYIGHREIFRRYQEYKAGTSAKSFTLGNATTNCTDYGSGSMIGSSYFGSGSLHCTTTPANRIDIPGKSAVPAGVRQNRVDIIIDCKDRTWAVYMDNEKVDGWKKFEIRSEQGMYAYFFCKDGASKAGLPESDFIKLAK